MKIVENIALISINETMLVQVASFLIFLWIINRIMFRPLESTIKEREAYLACLKTEIETAECDLEGLRKKLSQGEFSVRAEAHRIRTETEAAGGLEAKKVFVAMYAEINAIKEQTEKEVNRQCDEARRWMEKESEALSVAIMEKILGRRLS